MRFNALYLYSHWVPTSLSPTNPSQSTMDPKVLIVLTSVAKIPGTDHQIGWFSVHLFPVLYFPYLFMLLWPYYIIQPEFAHAYYVLKEKAEMVIASPDGGETPLDPPRWRCSKTTPHAWNSWTKASRSGRWLESCRTFWRRLKGLMRFFMSLVMDVRIPPCHVYLKDMKRN